MYVKFSNCKVSVTSDKRISTWIRSEFYALAYHRFTQIDLPTIESDIPPIVNLDYMILAAIFVFIYLITIRSFTWNIYVRRTFHSQRFMRSFIVVTITPVIKSTFCIGNIFGSIMERCLVFVSRRLKIRGYNKWYLKGI